MRKLLYIASASLMLGACGEEEKTTKEAPEFMATPAATNDTIIVTDPKTGEEIIQIVEPNPTENKTSRKGRPVSSEEIRQMERDGFVAFLDNAENAARFSDGTSTTRIIYNRTMIRKGVY